MKHKDITYNIQNPWLLSTIIELDSDTKSRMISTVESQIETANYHGGWTFEVTSSYNDFTNLYNIFKEICLEIFDDIKISKNNRTICWANVYNAHNYRSNMHHHMRTCSINSVFYLKMPKDTREGGLKLYHQNQFHLYIPEELELIIMPSWMPHEPMPHSDEENRISINMEIMSDLKIDEIYSVEKIRDKCKFVI